MSFSFENDDGDPHLRGEILMLYSIRTDYWTKHRNYVPCISASFTSALRAEPLSADDSRQGLYQCHNDHCLIHPEQSRGVPWLLKANAIVRLV